MMSMLPGVSPDMFPGGGNNDKQQQLQIKRHITIIESMTEMELDCTNVKILGVGRRRRGASSGFQVASDARHT